MERMVQEWQQRCRKWRGGVCVGEIVKGRRRQTRNENDDGDDDERRRPHRRPGNDLIHLLRVPTFIHFVSHHSSALCPVIHSLGSGSSTGLRLLAGLSRLSQVFTRVSYAESGRRCRLITAHHFVFVC